LCNILSGLFGDCVEIQERSTEVAFRLHRVEFYRSLVKIGLKSGAKRKRIPEIILRSPKTVVASYLRGLFSADGSVGDLRTGGTVSLSSVSKETVEQVQVILLNYFGLKSSISTVDNSCYSHTKTSGESYILRISGSRVVFFREIGFCYDSKSKKLEGFLGVSGRNSFERVKSVEFVGFGDVYDVSVEGDPSYSVNGFISHNSAESIQQFKKRGVEAKLQSVDRDDTQYKEFCYRLDKHQVSMYDYPPFEDEFFYLYHDRKKKKVDHEPGRSKDVSDSVVGSVFNCLENLGMIRLDQTRRDDISAFLKAQTQRGETKKDYASKIEDDFKRSIANG
jgi:hypothetical protein